MDGAGSGVQGVQASPQAAASAALPQASPQAPIHPSVAATTSRSVTVLRVVLTNDRLDTVVSQPLPSVAGRTCGGRLRQGQPSLC